MKKIWILSLLWICLLFTSCFNNRQDLPENPIIFSETEIDWNWAIENDWKYYLTYSTIKPKWVIWDFNYAFWDCLWYVGDDKNDRIYELNGESADEWLIKYYVNGEMEMPMVLREISISNESYIPESVEEPEEDIPEWWWERITVVTDMCEEEWWELDYKNWAEICVFWEDNRCYFDDLAYWSCKNRNILAFNENIPAFEELNNVVGNCDDDFFDYNIYQKAYILPYKDWYIWYQLGWQEGRELYLTYRKLEDPCNIIAQSDNIFWWNPWYKEWQETFRWASYPDNKIYIAQWLFSWVPTEEIAKELNCEPGKNFEDQDHTCTEEAEKYFYDLMVWNEKNEYFTQWMNKLKQDIDNWDYKTFSFYREEYDTCSQKVVDLIWTIQPNQDEKARWEYQVKRTENMHNCVLENLNK